MKMTSSSEEDNSDFLKECTDPIFFKDSLYSEGLSQVQEKEIIKPSLRKKNEQGLDNILNVSSHFQDFVYINHEKGITKTFKDKKVLNTLPYNRCNHISNKIKLFNNSTIYLKADASQMTVNYNNIIRNKLKKKNELNEDKLTKQCAEVAVTSEWILSGKAINGWEKSTKGEIIVIKGQNNLNNDNNNLQKSNEEEKEEKSNKKRLKQIEKRKKKKEKKAVVLI